MSIASHRGSSGGGRGQFGAAAAGGGADEDIFASYDSSVIRRFAAYLKPYRLMLAGALVAVLIAAAGAVAVPDMIRRVINAAITHQDHARLNGVVLAFVGLVVMNICAAYLEQRATSRLGARVIYDLRRAMFVHLQNLSLSFMDKTHVGRIMARVQSDVNVLQEFLEGSISALGDFVVLAGVIVMLLVLDWKLGLLTLSVIPVLIALRAIWLPYSKRNFRHARDASSAVNSALAENISGVRTVQESRREAVNFAAYDRTAQANLKAQVSASATAQIMVPAVDVLTGFAIAIVIVVGGRLVLGGALDVGVMVACIFYVQRFFEPVRTLSMQYTNMQQAMAAGRRIFEVLDVPVTIADRPDATTMEAVEPSVELRDVTFSYIPGRPVLHDVSFAARPREVVALVGATGSGKTSIAALINRFYEADSGQVLVGGHDVRDVTMESLGCHVGMVLQDPFLFTGTIEDNIRYKSTQASRDEVIAASKAVAAHDFIMRLPGGYDTQLGQRGRNLSAGQRQLIAFARVLVADPRVLILDEATANIDSFTEQTIQKALKVLFRNRTCIVIAHRLATIRDADRIIVLRQGRIVEQGPHGALMAQNGLYAALYASAHASFDDAAPEAVSDPAFASMT